MDSHRATLGELLRDPNPVPSYGGELYVAPVIDDDTQSLMQRVVTLPRIHIDQHEFRDLDLIVNGLFSPLNGFLDQENYLAVIESMQLASGLPWAWPATVAASDDEYVDIARGGEVALYYFHRPVAILSVGSVFRWNPELECARLFPLCDSLALPVQSRRERGKKHLVAGTLHPLSGFSEFCNGLRHPGPMVARAWFARNGWRRIAAVTGVQLWRRSHEQLVRSALETSDAVIVFPDYSGTANRNLPFDAQRAVEQQLVREYFPEQRVWLHSISRHVHCTGARSVLQQAIIAQNYGCDRLYFASDDQGDREWGPVIERARGAGLAVHVQRMGAVYHCERCGTQVSAQSCPHGRSHGTHETGDDLLEMLNAGQALPPESVRPEIARALARLVATGDTATTPTPSGGRFIFPHASAVSRELRQALAGHGAAVLWMTGLSGSGKSTIATRLEKHLVLSGHRAFVLDGDTLRHGLCSDLDFSREARDENIRRAAEVAKILSDSATIVIASFISPFRSEREQLARILGDAFIEVYVEASLETCESRDPKGLYRRARAGQIPDFTGVSSPYEPPLKPDLHVNTDDHSIDECVHLLLAGMGRYGLLRSIPPVHANHGSASDIRVSDQRFQ
jgi:adenylyl-sulfate kinase